MRPVRLFVVLALGDIRHAVAEIARATGAQRAILFGSFARGTATPRSDVDLIFIEETDRPFLARLDKYMDPLVDRLRTGIEVLVYTPKEFDAMVDLPFVGAAVEEGIVLYESGKVYRDVAPLARSGAG